MNLTERELELYRKILSLDVEYFYIGLFRNEYELEYYSLRDMNILYPVYIKIPFTDFYDIKDILNKSHPYYKKIKRSEKLNIIKDESYY